MEKEHPAYRFDDLASSEPNTQEEWKEAKEKEGVPTTHKEAMERLKMYAQEAGDDRARTIAEEELAKEEESKVIHKLDQLLAQDGCEGISSFLSTVSGKKYILGAKEKIEVIAEKWPQQEGIARKCRRILKELEESSQFYIFYIEKEGRIAKLEEIIAKNKKVIDTLSKIIDDKEALTIMAYDSKVMGTKSVGEKWDDYGTMDWSAYNVAEYKYDPKENGISAVKEGRIMNEEEFNEWKIQYENKAIDQMVNAMDSKDQSAEKVIFRFPEPIHLPALAKIELKQDGSGLPRPTHLPVFAKNEEAYQLAPKDEEDIKEEINNYLERRKKNLKNTKHELDAVKNEQPCESISMRWKTRKKV